MRFMALAPRPVSRAAVPLVVVLCHGLRRSSLHDVDANEFAERERKRISPERKPQ